MSHWENIIKDRLEGYESPLPEDGLAEFRALYDRKKGSVVRKAIPWMSGLALAAAAGLAAVLFLKKPAAPEEGFPPEVPVAVTEAIVRDSVDIEIPETVKPWIERAVPRRKTAAVSRDFPEVVQDVPVAPKQTDEEPDSSEIDLHEATIAESVPSVVVPSSSPIRDMGMGIAPAAGGVLGAGALAALVSTLADGGNSQSVFNPSTNGMNAFRHSMPLRFGISAWIPVAERFRVSTGLAYSLYSSQVNSGNSGEKVQWAHYLGVPVRLDYIIASNTRFDVYAGAGAQGEICLNATYAGYGITKDGFSLSLLGVGGIQWNVTRRLGLYIEPELSWRMPVGEPVLETYRNRFPVMFSVGAGVRINL